MNKAYLRKLDRKFDRYFKNKLSGRLTNTSKSVYSFEGEVLSEMDDEYDSEEGIPRDNKSRLGDWVADQYMVEEGSEYGQEEEVSREERE